MEADEGTARNDSAAVITTMGRTRAAIVSPAAITFLPPVFPPNPIPLTIETNTARPRRPNTIDGTPARLRTVVSIHLVSRLSGAYSSR